MGRIEITEARLASLPRWARMEIERLQRNEEHYKAKLQVGPEDSDTFADPYSAAKRPLGRGTSIQFVLGQDKHGRDLRLTVQTARRHDGTIILDVIGNNGIIVFPRASNSVEIGDRGD